MSAFQSLQSSNPVLANDDAFEQYYGSASDAKADVTTLQGVVNATGILVTLAVIAGAGGYALAPALGWGAMAVLCIVTLIVAIGIGVKLGGSPQLAIFLAPVYAGVEGFFLGAVTGILDGILKDMAIAGGGYLALQAFIITISVMLAMLGLYSARIIRPSRMLFSVLVTLTAAVFITYLISFALMLVGIRLPFIWAVTALDGGTGAWIGVGINVLIMAIAAFWLIFDFHLVEQKVKSGAPKRMEWYCAFALIVTLAWIYFEAVKLAFRLAVIFGSRD